MNVIDKYAVSQERTIDAIRIKLVDRAFLAVIVWPDRDTDKPCCKLPESSQSWLDVRPGDTVLLKNDKNVWTQRTVEEVSLYRVFPTEFNGTTVTCARDWLEGRE